MHLITQLTDRVLVESFLLSRDESLFRLLYRRHADALWRLALRLNGGDRAQAGDIVQDAWLRAIERLPGFRWESTLRTWLCGFVVLRVKEYWRTQSLQNQRMENFETALFEPLPPTFDPAVIDLERAFAQLAPGFRAVLTLHDLEGFRHEEIAALLGIAVGTSKSQLARARQAVRRLLSETV